MGYPKLSQLVDVVHPHFIQFSVFSSIHRCSTPYQLPPNARRCSVLEAFSNITLRKCGDAKSRWLLEIEAETFLDPGHQGLSGMKRQ
jgi:hypothetical protein